MDMGADFVIHSWLEESFLYQNQSFIHSKMAKFIMTSYHHLSSICDGKYKLKINNFGLIDPFAVQQSIHEFQIFFESQ